MSRRDLLSMKDLLFLSGILMALVWSLGTGYAEQKTSETAYIQADRDNTLFEDPMGEISNGSGPVFFVGRSSPSQLAPYTIRRGLIYFDVASVVPENAIIESVALNLYKSKGNVAPVMVGLYRAQSEWSEGPSASSGGGGGGSNALPGDVTWFHTYFDTDGEYMHRVQQTTTQG